MEIQKYAALSHIPSSFQSLAHLLDGGRPARQTPWLGLGRLPRLPDPAPQLPSLAGLPSPTLFLHILSGSLGLGPVVPVGGDLALRKATPFWPQRGSPNTDLGPPNPRRSGDVAAQVTLPLA